MKQTNFIIISSVMLFLGIFMGSCHNSEDDLRQKIEGLDKISQADKKELDSLFLKFDPVEYPKIDYDDCSNVNFIQRKIDYIKKIKPHLLENYYQDVIDNCNKIEPDFVNIFLETSASMKGYYACPVFTGASSIRVPEYGGREKINCYLYSDVLSAKMNYDDFSEKLSKNQIQTGKDSKFDKMFDKIIGHTPKNTISFFVTDAIIAAENREIRTETPEGLARIYQSMLDNIRDRLREAKKENPGFSVSVYRFTGTFDGTYYDSNDKPHKLNTQRPFFVFALGDKRITDDFRKKVNAGNELPKFKPVQQIHFNGGSNPSFYFMSDQIGTDDNKVQEGVINDNDSVLLTVMLRNFPEYVLNKEYITGNCHAKNAYGEMLNKTEVRDRSFSLKFETGNLSNENNITVNIDMTKLPAWCSQFSTKDDKNITDPDSTTFYIEELIEAIRAGVTRQNTIEGFYKFTK